MSKAKTVEEENPAIQSALREFLEDWRADVPADASGGSYAPTERDRWAEKSYDGVVPDGVLFDDGWYFVFAGGRFVQATGFVPQNASFFVEQSAFMPVAAEA